MKAILDAIIIGMIASVLCLAFVGSGSKQIGRGGSLQASITPMGPR
jgi:hypothetical protein